MSESETTQSPEDVTSNSTNAELLLTKFERLPDTDKKLFAYGPLYLGMNGAFTGLIANSFFRRVLKISQGWITSSLPMAVLPFLSTVALYQATVSQPLLSGNLNCKSCAEIRGAILGVIVGGLYPIALALPVNAGLASRYNTTPIPEKGKVIPFMVKVTKPVVRKMAFVLVLQAISGYYLTSLHHRIYRKLLELPASDSKDQEIVDVNKIG